VRDAMFENQGRGESEASDKKYAPTSIYSSPRGQERNNRRMGTSGERFHVSDSGAGTPMIVSFVRFWGTGRMAELLG
jgi:hypothetical protein